MRLKSAAKMENMSFFTDNRHMKAAAIVFNISMMSIIITNLRENLNLATVSVKRMRREGSASEGLAHSMEIASPTLGAGDLQSPGSSRGSGANGLDGLPVEGALAGPMDDLDVLRMAAVVDVERDDGPPVQGLVAQVGRWILPGAFERR